MKLHTVLNFASIVKKFLSLEMFYTNSVWHYRLISGMMMHRRRFRRRFRPVRDFNLADLIL